MRLVEDQHGMRPQLFEAVPEKFHRVSPPGRGFDSESLGDALNPLCHRERHPHQRRRRKLAGIHFRNEQPQEARLAESGRSDQQGVHAMLESGLDHPDRAIDPFGSKERLRRPDRRKRVPCEAEESFQGYVVHDLLLCDRVRRFERSAHVR